MIYKMYPTFWSQVNVNWRKQCKHSEVMGGDPTSVVFSAPLHGGSPDEWVTEFRELRDHLQGSSFPQLDGKRCRHRVAPNTALARPRVTLPPLTEGLRNQSKRRLRGGVKLIFRDVGIIMKQEFTLLRRKPRSLRLWMNAERVPFEAPKERSRVRFSEGGTLRSVWRGHGL